MTAAANPDKDKYRHDWLCWISENIARGSKPEDMVEQMVGAGLDRGLSERSVAEAAEHPYVIGARRAVVAIADGAPFSVE